MGFFKDRYTKLDAVILTLAISLSAVKFYNFLLFHSLVELFSIGVAISLSVIAFNSFKRSENNVIMYLGIAYLFIGILDTFHILAYKGMNVLEGGGSNMATQFWIATRYIEAISILIAFSVKDIKRFRGAILAAYTVVTLALSYILLETNLFPTCFVEGSGLTAFKVGSEYIIIGILLTSLVIAHRNKKQFSGYAYHYIFWAIVYTAMSEFAFTLYADVYGITNAVGHIFKIFSYYMVYKGIVVIAISGPYDKLEIEKAKFFSMFENAKHAMLLLKEQGGKELRILDANIEACKMFGYKKGELNYRSLDMLLFDDERRPIDKAKFVEAKSDLFEVRHMDKFKKLIPADVSIHTVEVFDETIKMADIRDISIRKRYEKEVNLFESIFENAIESIMVVNNENKVKWVNKGFEKLYGFEPGEICGKDVKILQSEYQDRLFIHNVWREIDETGQWQGETWNKCKDGTVIPVYQSVVAGFTENREVDHYVTISIDLTEKKDNEKKMFELAYFDSVTGLQNRYYIQNKLNYLRSSGILFIKLNNIKRIENKYGEKVRNALIKSIIALVKRSCVELNIYQYASNRLAIIFEETLKPGDMKKCCQYLEALLKQSFEIYDKNISLNFTLGMIENNVYENWSVPEMLRKVQVAITYADSFTGQTSIEYTQAIEKELMDEEDLVVDLSNAIANNELDVHYQPIVDIYTGEMYGVEALARWYHPGKGSIPPTRFIDIAERHDLILEIGYYILEKACNALKQWHEGKPNLMLNVNVSILQLLNKDFVSRVKGIVMKSGIDKSKLMLEITESVAIDNFESIRDTLDKLHDFGIQFALDDFGTGYSSLSKLKQLPITAAKIDRSFVYDLNVNLQNSLLISAMIAMSNKMGLTVIVEGVEGNEQLRYLKNNNCRLVQGFYFSRPVKEDAITMMLEKPFKQYEIDGEGLTLEEIEKIDRERERFRKLHQTKPMGYVLLNGDGSIAEANNIFATMIGFSRNEVIGMRMRDIVVGKDEQEIADRLKGIMEQGKAFDIEGKLKTKSGEVIDVIVNGYFESDEKNEPAMINCLIEDVTGTLENEKNLIRMREGYRKIFTESPLGIVLWNSEFEITNWNKHAEKVFGWSQESIVGKNMDLIVRKEDFTRWKKHADRVLSGIPIQTIMTNMCKSGEAIICEWFNELVYNQAGKVEFVISIVKDITEERKKDETIMKMVEAFEQAVYEVFIIAVSGEFEYANRRFKELRGIQGEWISGLKLEDIDIEFLDDEIKDRDELVKKNVHGWKGISRNRDMYKDEYLAETSVSPVKNKDGEVISHIFALRDLSDELKKEEEIKHLKDFMQKQERMAVVGQLAAGVAHEINNPLSYMTANSSAMKKEFTKYKRYMEEFRLYSEELGFYDKKDYSKTSIDGDLEFIEEDFDDIMESFDDGFARMKEIVESLKSYSWLESKEKFSKYNINDALEKVLTIAHNELKYYTTVKLELNEGVPAIEAIGNKIDQVLLNLIINASHAVKKKFENEMGEITIKTDYEGDQVYCTIQDNGTGIEKKIMESIFEPFFTTKPEGIGSGLGLSISSEIIKEKHHGDIRVESEVGVGTRFILKLPVKQPDANYYM